ncbi:MAG: hypothetical protein LH613_18345 [Chamaesiphon sp.]|nr:hypothetical protein [Chamaesiphon sp.]
MTNPKQQLNSSGKRLNHQPPSIYTYVDRLRLAPKISHYSAGKHRQSLVVSSRITELQ